MRAMFRTALLGALFAVAWSASCLAAPSYTGRHCTATTFSGTNTSCSIASFVATDSIRVFYYVDADTLTVAITQASDTFVAAAASGTTGGGVYSIGGAIAVNAAAASTITATASGTVTQLTIQAEEWSGDPTSSPLDSTGAGQYVADGTIGTSLLSGTFTTSTNNNDIECALFQAQNAAPTLGTNFSAVQTTTGFYSEHWVQPTAGVNTNGFGFLSGTGSNDNYVMCFAVKPVAGVASPNPARSLFIHPGPF